ncbi:ISAzo13 family transposase [Salininema proteolyticum]
MASKYELIKPHLNERQWRLFLGAEAQALDQTGIDRSAVSVVAQASGASKSTVRTGLAEIEAGAEATDRVRAPGAGRPRLEIQQPGITKTLEALVEPTLRGEPTSTLKWTCKSLKELREALRRLGFTASIKAIANLLHEQGYRLQKTKKTREGGQHPDRDAQFEYIDTKTTWAISRGYPVLSIDCKNKELVGNYTAGGREWRPKDNPVEVEAHDFPAGVPKAIPYGVYDIGADTGWISVGVSRETAQFAANTIRQWWHAEGRDLYDGFDRLYLVGDAGGSDGYRSNLWKLELADLAAELKMDIVMLHFPPGTSKWNKIEHRLFSFVTLNWRGQPLQDYQIVLDRIGGTETENGLIVTAWLDERVYATGRRATKQDLAEIGLQPHEFHGEWNYTIKQPTSQPAK